MAKYRVVKKVVSEENYYLFIESKFTPEQVKYLVEDCTDIWEGCEFEPYYDRVDIEEYKLDTVVEGNFPDSLSWDDFDEDECVVDFLADASAAVAAAPAVSQEKRAFVEALVGVLKQVKAPYTEQGEEAEKFWEAGFKYADKLLGDWEKLQYPDGAEDTETTTLAGALKDLWESVETLHSADTGEGETGESAFVVCLEEVKELLTEIDPDWPED